MLLNANSNGLVPGLQLAKIATIPKGVPHACEYGDA